MQRQTKAGANQSQRPYLANTVHLFSHFHHNVCSHFKGDSQFSTSKGRICVMVRNLDEIQNKENITMYNEDVD